MTFTLKLPEDQYVVLLNMVQAPRSFSSLQEAAAFEELRLKVLEVQPDKQ